MPRSDRVLRALVLALSLAVLLRPRSCGPSAPTRSPPSSPASVRVRPLDEARRAELARFVHHAAARLWVPGAAVAVIVGGEVVYEQVLGQTELRPDAPAIGPTTLFLIGSLTKPMTTLAEASLVDAGVLRWDSKLTELLPTFAVGDAELTRALLLWHSACACSGMPRQDLENLFEFAGVTPERRLASMRAMKPTAPLGAVHQYSNLMVAAGGFAAAHAAYPDRPLGEAYDALMAARVFAPIGMVDSTLDFAVAAQRGRALPHALAIDGSLRAVAVEAEKNVLPIRPAGGVWSNLRDLERYAVTELRRGVSPDGRRVVSEAGMLARWTSRILDPDGTGYGLGIDVGTYGGQPMLAHDGGSLGFGSSMLLFPEAGVGIVVLSNARTGGDYEQLPFHAAVKRKVFEALFDPPDASADALLESLVAARAAFDARRNAGLELAPERTWLDRLVGDYAHAALGPLSIRAVGGEGVLDVGEWQTTFGRRVGEGQVHLVFLDPPFAGAELRVDTAGPRPRLVVETRDPYVFERR
ncbi:MAG: beta-lactamase family protein [Myxococcales bacterium]|nr:beta-lactamase family protein [Myxococcales bacterium]